jgi:hypothetical protein
METIENIARRADDELTSARSSAQSMPPQRRFATLSTICFTAAICGPSLSA